MKQTKQKIIITILIMSLLVLSACSNKADTKNEEILQKVLDLEKINTNKVNINKEQIFISIEASSADEYDTQLINWWGTIFGISAMLQGNYEVVIIENTVNKEPYTYISTNVYTIRDFNEDKISDAEFWDETLITSEKPRTREILQASGLPTQTLKDDAKIKVPRTQLANIIIYSISTIMLIVLVVLIIVFLKKKNNKTHINKKEKQKQKEIKKEHKEKNKTNHVKNHVKKISDKVKTGTKKFAEKTKEKTRSFKEKLKQEPGR